MSYNRLGMYHDTILESLPRYSHPHHSRWKIILPFASASHCLLVSSWPLSSHSHRHTSSYTFTWTPTILYYQLKQTLLLPCLASQRQRMLCGAGDTYIA